MQIDYKKKMIILIILIIGLIIGFIIYTTSNKLENQFDSNDYVIEENIVDENDLNEEKKIVIHITGEVQREGILYLEEGARIVDAIKKAGGETKEADLSQINLAYELQDGQKIYIPNKKDKISEPITENSGNNVIIENNSKITNDKGKTKVNINTATQSELEELPGIGPSIAQRIIEYREENGKFNEIEELQNVKGIGDAKYENIKNNVTV